MILQKLTEAEFAQMAKLVYDRAGIYLPECKLSLLSNRLRKRLRALKLGDFADYYDLLRDRKRCAEELPNFLSAVTTNETYFFRNENLWKFFRNEWMPELVERKAKSLQKFVRVWSAATSSGEEAYTAAICLRESLPKFESWNVTIIGSDISERVLDQARAGIYNAYAVSKVRAATLRRWFEGGGEENRASIASGHRSCHFSHLFDNRIHCGGQP